MNQTEGMCLLIPRGPEGQLYCQSALRIRTIIVYTGKDSKEMAQANLKRVIQEIEDLRVHGLRYSAKHDTFLNKVSANGTKAHLESFCQSPGASTGHHRLGSHVIIIYRAS